MGIRELTKEHQNIAIITHMFPDWDAVWSAVGLGEVLKKTGKNITYFSPNQPNKALVDIVWVSFKILESASELEQFDLIIAVDSGDERMVFWLLDTKISPDILDKILVIDHHHSNSGWWKRNLINGNKWSNCQRISELIIDEFPNELFDDRIATSFLLGMYTDTWGFLWGVDKKTFEIADFWLKKWANQTKIVEKIFLNKHFGGYQFLSRVINRLKLEEGFAWTWFDDKDLAEFGLDFEEAKWYVAPLLKIKDVDYVILFKRYWNLVGGSIRSVKNDADKLATFLGGGGHKAAAGFKVTMKEGETFEELVERVLEKVKKYISNYVSRQ